MLANDGIIPFPRTPEEVIHNVILRQMEDDLHNTPVPELPNPALALLRKVQVAKDVGQSLVVYADEAAKLLQGLDAEEKLTFAVVRQERLRELCDRMEMGSKVRKFLKRVFDRGDFTPREALIFSQMNTAALESATKFLAEVLEVGPDAPTPDDFSKMDWSLQVTEKTSNKAFAGTTPQEREIIRKITIRARRKLFKTNAV